MRKINVVTRPLNYTVNQGESLPKIANDLYGKPSLWKSIYNENRKVIGRNPSKLQPNTTITVPSLTSIIEKKGSRTQALWAFEALERLNKN